MWNDATTSLRLPATTTAIIVASANKGETTILRVMPRIELELDPIGAGFTWQSPSAQPNRKRASSRYIIIHLVHIAPPSKAVRTFDEHFPTSQSECRDFHPIRTNSIAKRATPFPGDADNPMAHVARLEGTAELRPDTKLVISRAWATPRARLNTVVQLSRGLAKAAG